MFDEAVTQLELRDTAAFNGKALKARESAKSANSRIGRNSSLRYRLTNFVSIDVDCVNFRRRLEVGSSAWLKFEIIIASKISKLSIFSGILRCWVVGLMVAEENIFLKPSTGETRCMRKIIHSTD